MIKLGAVVNFSLLSFLSFVRVLFLASPLLTAGDGLRFLQAVLSALLSHCVYSAKLELLTPLSRHQETLALSLLHSPSSSFLVAQVPCLIVSAMPGNRNCSNDLPCTLLSMFPMTCVKTVIKPPIESVPLFTLQSD